MPNPEQRTSRANDAATRFVCESGQLRTPEHALDELAPHEQALADELAVAMRAFADAEVVRFIEEFTANDRTWSDRNAMLGWLAARERAGGEQK